MRPFSVSEKPLFSVRKRSFKQTVTYSVPNAKTDDCHCDYADYDYT